MIRSMTGFARSSFESQDINMTVEVRALNSKNLELNLRLPYSYRSWEDELRTAIKPQLLRGKVDVNFNVNHQGAAAAAELNKDIISDYIQQLREIADVTPAELLPIATRLPDALQSAEVLPGDKQKKEVFGLVQQAIRQLIDYQTAEGQAMINDLNTQIESIKKGLEHVNDKKDLRIQQVRSKLQDNLKSLAVEVDQNRFEQELIFYLEKFDINEEIVRLRQHLLYFHEVMNNESEIKGKKLGLSLRKSEEKSTRLDLKSTMLPYKKKLFK